MRYVTRSQWGARPPKSWQLMPRPVGKVYIHHSVTPLLADPATTVRQIQAQHMDVQGWNDIAYQELVAHNGDVFEGRGFDVQGGATRGENATSLAICALGNFDTMVPPSAVIGSIVNRIVAAAQTGHLSPGFTIHGHRDANATACPGRFLYEALPSIRLRVAAALKPTPAPVPSEDDMYVRYNLHPSKSPSVWMICPGGDKWGITDPVVLSALEASGLVKGTVDLSGSASASQSFLDGHPG